MELKYFTLSEFDCPTLKGSGINMDATLLQMLDELRFRYGKPIRITSGYRTKEHNEAVGGVPDSSHLRGLAVDIAATSSRERHNLLRLAIEVGFNRIGIAKTFIHVDIDSDKPEKCVWTY